MPSPSDLPNRQSLRYKGYDYSAPGAYFVTICTRAGHSFFGEVVHSEMIINQAGWMVERCWRDLSTRYPTIQLDEFCVMPNHVHMILWLQADANKVNKEVAPSLGAVVGAFKSITTHKYVLGVRTSGWPRFDGKLWHRNYWDRIVRDEVELENFRHYIRTNPARWPADQLHPDAAPNRFKP